MPHRMRVLGMGAEEDLLQIRKGGAETAERTGAPSAVAKKYQAPTVPPIDVDLVEGVKREVGRGTRSSQHLLGPPSDTRKHGVQQREACFAVRS